MSARDLPTDLARAVELEAAMRLHGVPRSERAARFEDLRTMERSALSVWARQRAGAHAGHGRPNG